MIPAIGADREPAKLPGTEEFTMSPQRELSLGHGMTKFGEEATIGSNQNMTMGPL